MKKIFSIIFVLMLGLTLVSCRRGGGNGGGDIDPEPEPGDVVTVRYWNPITGGDSAQMRKLVADFNKEYEGKIEVIEQYTPEESHYENLELLVPMHRGPDIALVHSHRVYGLLNNNIIKPLDTIMEGSEVTIDFDDYVEDVVNATTIDGKNYAVPLDLHTVGVYYNKTLLAKYDLEIPENRAEFIHAAEIVQAGERADGNSTFYGLPLSNVWPSEWIYTTSLYQNGGQELIGTEEPGFNTDEGLKAMQMLADLIHVNKLSSHNISVDQDLFSFQNGNALFHIQGSWMLNAVLDSRVSEEFGVFPLSNLFTDTDSATKDQVHARSHVFVATKTQREPSQAKKDAMLTFVKFMTEHSYIWAEVGQIPASNIARETEEYKNLEYIHDFGNPDNFRVAVQSPYYQEGYGVVYERVTQIMSLSNASNYTEQAIKDALQDAYDEGVLLIQGLK